MAIRASESNFPIGMDHEYRFAFLTQRALIWPGTNRGFIHGYSLPSHEIIQAGQIDSKLAAGQLVD